MSRPIILYEGKKPIVYFPVEEILETINNVIVNDHISLTDKAAAILISIQKSESEAILRQKGSAS